MQKSILIKELWQAQKLSSRYEGGYSGEFLNAKEFSKALKEAIELFESGNDCSLKDLMSWFAPTTEWDDFIGEEGMKLGNSIFDKIGQYIEQNNIKI